MFADLAIVWKRQRVSVSTEYLFNKASFPASTYTYAAPSQGNLLKPMASERRQPLSDSGSLEIYNERHGPGQTVHQTSPGAVAHGRTRTLVTLLSLPLSLALILIFFFFF